MTVRLRLALTVLLTGVATALGVILTVALAFQRFEHESAFLRADAFLERVVAEHDDLLDKHQRNPGEFTDFLRNLLLFEPDSQLYLLDRDGTVLASTGKVLLAPGFKVTLGPVQQAAEASRNGAARRRAAYVMGDDPEHMSADAVVAARAITQTSIRATEPVAGYIYVVWRKSSLPGQQLALFGSSLAGPALFSVFGVVLLGTLLAAWIIVTVTRPLRVLSEEVDRAAQQGFRAAAEESQVADDDGGRADEFSRLRAGFRTLMSTLRGQWDELRRLDHFRRESVSNLSHDLRSPLTATVACLETLEDRWQAQPDRDDDRRLVAMALRNTQNAARLVRSLGDLALLDEPEFKLHLMRVDLGDLLDDVTLRFAQRAAGQSVTLSFEQRGDTAPVAEVDIELFERAVANVLDNALRHTPAGGQIVVGVEHQDGQVRVSVSDSGSGIPEHDIEHLFDRHYRGQGSVEPASSGEGKGLGLAIVKRIAELHRGTVALKSAPGAGTCLTLVLPAA